MTVSLAVRNRVGFILLGLTNNFAYVIMLTAAHDLLKQSADNQPTAPTDQATSVSLPTNTTPIPEKYCNEYSTSAILLADTIPSLATKLIYPVALVGLPVAYKASATALLSAASFLVTGLFTDQVLIFTGVACASFSSGLGESTYLSNTPLYGDVSLSGWSMGTGGAGLLGSAAYAVLKMVLSIKTIMMLMLVVPITMMIAYCKIIKPVDSSQRTKIATAAIDPSGDEPITTLSVISRSEDENSNEPIHIDNTRTYGSQATVSNESDRFNSSQLVSGSKLTLRQKFDYLPTLAKYFLPLLLVYFAEYFINQGLFELIYYPAITFLDHAAQYRWFQVTYQLGVFISRSSLDLFQIRRLWTMSLLQAANALLFLAHVSKLIYIPSFYIVIALIVYEGLLGGFTYANTFYRMKKELSHDKHEFAVSTVTIADTLGIVIAGAVSLPVHNALCKLYE